MHGKSCSFVNSDIILAGFATFSGPMDGVVKEQVRRGAFLGLKGLILTQFNPLVFGVGWDYGFERGAIGQVLDIRTTYYFEGVPKIGV